MTEITRVPLQPVKKGSLAKLWLGVATALALGIGTALASGHRGIELTTLKAGTGASPTTQDVVLVNYVGRLENGNEFDRGEKVPFPVSGVVPGFSEGLTKMQKGGKYRLEIPSSRAYGAGEQRNPQTGAVVIPANADLVFEVELIDFRNQQEIMRQQQMMEQLQQMQQEMPQGGQAPPRPQP